MFEGFCNVRDCTGALAAGAMCGPFPRRFQQAAEPVLPARRIMKVERDRAGP
jgi:hypothetical protein